MPSAVPILSAIAMDEMAVKLGMDPIEFRIKNDTQVVPDSPAKSASNDPQSNKTDTKEKHYPHPPFSIRQLIKCFQVGAEHFGWDKRTSKPGQVRDGRWLVGTGVASAYRDNVVTKSAARVRLDGRGHITVETDMTDIGTGSYTIIAQTAAEMMGVPLEKVTVRLGDSSFPVSAGSGGQWGGNSSTSGVYAACIKLREAIAQKAEFNINNAIFSDSQSALHLSKNPVYHERTKHVDVRFHFIRDLIANHTVKLLKVSTKDNPADMGTKVVTCNKFRHCLDLLYVG